MKEIGQIRERLEGTEQTVILQGRIKGICFSYKLKQTKYYEMQVFLDGSKEHYVTVIVRDGILDYYESYAEGEYVRVEGEIRTLSKEKQRIFCVYANYIKIIGIEKEINEVTITGVIVSEKIIKRKDYNRKVYYEGKIVIATKVGFYNSIAFLDCYVGVNEIQEYLEFKYEEGNEIRAIGKIKMRQGKYWNVNLKFFQY